MPVTYRSAERSDYDAIRELLIEVGWQQRVTDTPRFEQMLAGATKTVVALDGHHLVGFGRALTDRASNGYISTLAVTRDYRRQGIGRELVAQLMDLSLPDGSVTWVLRSARGSEGFWRKMGFNPSSCAMEIVRTR
jgi:N-acetylglutamate synthase-like GNAT family acetyltransferase